MSPPRAVPPAWAVGRASAAAIVAGLASGFVAAVALYLIATWLAGLAGGGLGMMGAVVFVVPVVGVVTLLVPLAAGMIGGFVAGRPVAAIGSVVGVPAGLWTGAKLADSSSTLDVTLEGLVVLVTVLGVIAVIGHLTGSGLRGALRRR